MESWLAFRKKNNIQENVIEPHLNHDNDNRNINLDSEYINDTLNRGDIWISNDKFNVEWYVDDQCIRNFKFTTKIIKAGFVDFEKAPNCLIIILRDIAHVYYLSTGNSTTVCFPFPITNAFWYSQGIVLERLINVDTSLSIESNSQHKYITLTDPMSPFGLVTFSIRQKNNDEKNLVGSKMLLFAKDSDHNITILYNKFQNQLSFYYTRVLNSRNSQTNTDLLENNKNDVAKHLRKISILNRRTLSNTLTQNDGNSGDSNNANSGNSISVVPSQTIESLLIPQSVTKRSLSATLDRMSNSTTTPTIDFAPTSAQQLQQEYITQAISSKDIILTKISSINLPSELSNNLVFLKCIPLRFQDQEAVVFFDVSTQFIKVWSIKKVPNIINSLSFKAYGGSPEHLINLSNIDLIEPFKNILPYFCDNLPGTITIQNKNSEKIALYNPFLNLPLFSVNVPTAKRYIVDNLCFISTNVMKCNRANILSNENLRHSVPSLFYNPQKSSTMLYFEAIKWILPLNYYFAIVFLWQNIMSVTSNQETTHDTKSYHDFEFEAFFTVFKVLLQSTNQESFDQNFEPILNFLAETDLTTTLPNVILGLHLIREELLLNVLYKNDVFRLDQLLYFATTSMNWPVTWREYYNISNIFEPPMAVARYTAFPLDEPPSILKSLFSVTENSYIPLTPFINFSRLIEKDHHVDQLITPRSFKLLRLYELTHSAEFSIDQTLNVLSTLKISKSEIETYPIGIITPLRFILKKIENNISKVDIKVDISVLSRIDLERSLSIIKQIESGIYSVQRESNPATLSNTSDNEDDHNVEIKSIHTLLTDIVINTSNSSSNQNSLDQEEGEEKINEGNILKHNAGLIFSQDRRFSNALSLLIYYKPHNISFYSRQIEYLKIVNQKKIFAKIIFQRTCTSGIGWGTITYATEKPLSTQKWIRPKLNLVSLFPDGTKVSLNPTDVDEDTLSWGEFHGGVSSGLRICKTAKHINGSWISFNKPKELDSQHGGFLLGLGLNGHLSELEEWHVYNYLSPKLTHVSIGLLLGMSTSIRGTMDLKLTKVLSVHIVALLPQGSSDLNINLKVQTAGLVGIGLLYQKSLHKRMSEVLLSQITANITVNEEPVADEGYRTAAGIALGLVNLGSGNSETLYSSKTNSYDELSGSDIGSNSGPDINVIEKLINIVCESHDMEESWIPENSQVSGVIALMLIFLKTNNEQIAEKIKPTLPNIKSANIVSRPELYMYQVWAYNMILWDSIGDDMSFIFQDINRNIESNFSTDNLPVYYIIAGRVLAMGIKHSSSTDDMIRDVLLVLLDKFLPFYQYVGDGNIDFKLTITGINVVVNVILVSISMIMCGTGDILVFQRIRYLHEVITGKHSDLFKAVSKKTTNENDSNNDDNSFMNLVDADNSSHNVDEETNDINESDNAIDPTSDTEIFQDDENHYSKYMSTSMSLGFLFLGSGQYALKTSDLESTAYLIMSVLPNYMTPYNLQELKHFWSLSVEPRCLVVKNVQTDIPINNVSVEVTLKSKHRIGTSKKNLSTPCLLPDLMIIKGIKICSSDYYPLEINFNEAVTAVDYFKNGIVLYLQAKEKESYYDMENNVYKSSEGLQLALKSKMNSQVGRKLSLNKMTEARTISESLINKLDVTDLTMYELRNLANSIKNISNDSQKFNLEMICSDTNGGDTIDYQLELWKRNHK